ncbi:MAG: hypothetical protein ACTSQJ_00640 [Promethearchaeota archaeon]
MPKFRKESEKIAKIKQKKISDEEFAFKSVIISAIIGGIFIFISLLFNCIDILNLVMKKSLILTIINVSIKVAVILFAFFFIMVSLGNYKELTGKPVNWREMALLITLSLIQTFRNPLVLIISAIGLSILLIYFYLIQES